MILNKTGRKVFSTAAVLFTLLLFALLAMLLTTLGISVYKGVVGNSEQNYNKRMAVSYVCNRVRRADRAGAVTIGEFAGGDALLLGSEDNGVEYVTKIYFYNGSVCELFCRADSDVDAGAGTALIPAQGLLLSRGNGFVTVTVTDEFGGVSSSVIALKEVAE